MGLSLTEGDAVAHDIMGHQRLERLLGAVEPIVGDGSDEPAPFCRQCGADIGIFLKFGLDWRHYRGATLGEVELFDPGHAPVVAWREGAAMPN